MKQVNSEKYILGIIGFFLFFFLGHSGNLNHLFAAEDKALEAGRNGKNQYIIGMGDMLEINVWNEPDLSKEIFVRLDGRISLPLVGDVVADGHTPAELSVLLADSIGKYVEDPSVSVILLASKSKRYYMVGQIGKPGEWLIEQPITVLQAIARAGGFLEWAKVSEIKIIRKNAEEEKILEFDYDALIKKGALGKNILIEAGDTIIVP
jgi:polysaccharide export outer membrane protein